MMTMTAIRRISRLAALAGLGSAAAVCQSVGEVAIPIDPDGGRQSSAYMHTETRLDFHALEGTEARGQWLTGRPFLLVQAPAVLTLRPKEADWPDRIVTVANFLIAKP